MIKYLRLFRLLIILPMLLIVRSTQAGEVHPNEQASLSDFSWLAGTWQQIGDDVTVVEIWQAVSATTFEGYGFTINNSSQDTVATETLRIVEMGGEIFYLAKVSHNAYPIPFKLIDMKSNQAVFENSEHDFPQRISYAYLQTEGVSVIVEGTMRGEKRQLEFNFKRIK